MTDYILTSANLKTILKEVASDIKAHKEELRELDSIIGDGDLGITIELAGNGILGFLETANEADVGMLLAKCGMNINKASPSTFGTLLASAFLGAGQAVRNKPEIVADDLVSMGDGAIEGIKKRSKAEVGDKTMLDSLVPAIEAFKKKFEGEKDIAQALSAAVTAAEAGMQATVSMRAKYGRASWHQESTVGVRDAGATAMYYLVESFARHLIAYVKK